MVDSSDFQFLIFKRSVVQQQHTPLGRVQSGCNSRRSEIETRQNPSKNLHFAKKCANIFSISRDSQFPALSLKRTDSLAIRYFIAGRVSWVGLDPTKFVHQTHTKRKGRPTQPSASGGWQILNPNI